MASYISEVVGIVNATVSAPLKSQLIPAHVLYPGLDVDSLSNSEGLWVWWYTLIGDPVLATGIMSFVLHEVVYFGRCIPWMVIDSIPYFRQWKLQDVREFLALFVRGHLYFAQSKVPTLQEQWECTKYVLYTHFTIELPQIWGFHPLAEYFGMSTHQVPFPKWTTIAYQVSLFFLFEDFFHYCAHRLLHTPMLYKRIHKLHHTFSAPFGLAAEYAHPIEILVLGAGTIGGPFLWCMFSKGNLHILTMYIWITARLCQAVDAHSGYDFPWGFRHIFPLWAGADHHDYHHEKFTECYSTSFRIWDNVFGTDSSYKRTRAKQAADKQAACEAKKVQ